MTNGQYSLRPQTHTLVIGFKISNADTSTSQILRIHIHLRPPEMFAVPGWSVAADTLKAQVDARATKPAKEAKPDEANGTDRNSKKRKGGPGPGKVTNVTEDNLQELWRKYIEGNRLDKQSGELSGSAKRQQKKRKKERDAARDAALNVNDIDNTFGGLSEDSDREERQEEDAISVGGGNEKSKYDKEKERCHVVHTIGHVQGAEESPARANNPQEEEDGKFKYERRKAKAARRKEQRTLLQVNGAIPPTRPEVTLDATTKTTPSEASSSKSSETSNAPTPSKQPLPMAHKESSKAPKPPQPSEILRTSTASIPPTPPPLTTNLTPLQQRMAAKLTSARFRHLNQTLYTSTSHEAVQLFVDFPQAYTSYHAGFRAQVAVWPQNPVEGFVEDVKLRGRMSVPSQKQMWRDMKKGKKAKDPINEEGSARNGESGRQLEPLPRTRGVCTIADLGCGDAHLAGSLQPLKQALNLKLLAFDLAKGNMPNAHLITVADISNLAGAGVRDGSADIAICCLSLMGTNWVDIVGECARVVRGGGEVWIAEIKSRFARPRQVKKKGDGIGKKKVKRGSEVDYEENGDEEVEALEELEDANGPKDETDVSAFVEVFRKRGFALKSEPDMANKIFVRMRFVKAIKAEKAVENEKGGKARFGDGFRRKQVGKTKFVEGEGEVEVEVEVDESKVLKPCVYKTR